MASKNMVALLLTYSCLIIDLNRIRIFYYFIFISLYALGWNKCKAKAMHVLEVRTGYSLEKKVKSLYKKISSLLTLKSSCWCK